MPSTGCDPGGTPSVTEGDRGTAVRFTVLRGSIGATSDTGDAIALGGPQQRRLLAGLLADHGRVVSADRLVETLWPDGSAPDGARRTVMSYVSRLRTAIGEERVVHEEAGYSLALDGATYDAAEFEARLADAWDRAPADALVAYDEALALWSGRAFGDDADEWWLRPVAVRLEELRLVALEERAECLIETGRHTEAVAELERLVAEHPLRERFVALSMRALYLGGRQAEALRSYRSYHDCLAEETGLEPSETLIDLERRITLGDPTLAAATGIAVPGYELAEVIGEGAFGAVYRAVQPSIGREVAIKVVRPELADDPRFVQRFEAEAQLVARLEHPHVVPLYDFWRQPGGAYLVFRLLRGGSLADLVTDGPLPIERVTRLVDEISGALNAAHALGVVHRDVKPANVLFDETGNSYLADFGIAVAVGDNGEEQLDLRSAGSPLYASPEQARDGVATAASDQYSFAVLLWEALTGCAPFAGSTATEVLRAKLGVPVPPLTELRPDVPAALDQVLRRATAPHPADRYPNISELARAWQVGLAATDPVRTTGRLSGASGPRTASQTVARLQVGGTNPYKGLRAFREADASEFEGRDELVTALTARVGATSFVAVVGPSGSGKSSLVHAGLVPALRRDGALVVSMVPGSDPLAELEAALRRVATAADAAALRDHLLTPDGLVDIAGEIASDGTRLVLVVDQFEELWTLVDSGRARDRFTDLLVHAAERQASVRIVVTLRADLYDRPLQHPSLGPLVRDATFAATPMSASELQQAIVVPAERVGVHFEPGLVATIVDDVVNRAGALPLLQFTLTELYERRTTATVTAAAYAELGGIGGALARRAEQLYDDTAGERRADVRRLFTRLVTPGDDGDDLRRRATMPELADVSPEVVDRYRAHRLLVLDHHPITREPTIEVAHEALLREWPRLREWIDEDRDAIRVRRLLSQSAAEWEEHRRDESELYRGTRLAAADEVAAQLPLTSTEREFLGASRNLADRERADAEQRVATRIRQNRRLRGLLTATALLLVVAVVTGVVAFAQRGRADRKAQQAREVSVAAEVDRAVAEVPPLLERDRSLALLLAVQAHRLRPGAATKSALLGSLLGEPRLRLTLSGGHGGYNSIAAFPDGKRFAVLGRDGADVWDIAARKKIGSFAVSGFAAGISVSPDGTLIAAGSSTGSVTLWDARSLQKVGEPLHAGAPVTAVAFLPDGRELAVAVGVVESTDAITRATTAQLWDVGSRRRSGSLGGHARSVNAFAVSADGRVLAAGDNDGRVVFHNPSNGAPIGRPLQLDRREGIFNLAFSPNGRWLGLGTFGRSGPGSAHVFEVAARREVAQLGSASLMTVVFGADNKQFITAGETVDAWNTEHWTRATTEPIVTQHGPAQIASTRATGLVLTGFDGTMTVWDPNGLPTIATALRRRTERRRDVQPRRRAPGGHRERRHGRPLPRARSGSYPYVLRERRRRPRHPRCLHAHRFQSRLAADGDR